MDNPDDILNHNKSNSNPFQNSVDVIMIGVITNESIVNVSEIETREDVGCEQYGTLSQQSLSITILGNDTNLANLSSNVQIEFDCDSVIGCDEEHKCMWYNVTGNVWQDDGCDTYINSDDNKIKCSCSHLTTFATIRNIYKCASSSQFIEQLFTWKYWDYINLAIAALFFSISVYIFLEIYPFFIDKYLTYKQTSVIVMSLLFIVSLTYFMICVLFHFLKYYGLHNNR